MHALSSTLLAAQKSPKQTPYLRLRARCRSRWQEVYLGGEPAGLHSAAALPDGSLVRARISPPAEGSRLFTQRVSPACPPEEFACWQDSGKYNILAAALALCADTVNLFYITSGRRIEQLTSTDGGQTWQDASFIDYSPTTLIRGIYAACGEQGETVLFFADADTLFVKRASAGNWQPRTAWTHLSGDLSGIAGVYDGDFLLVISGHSATGEACLWRLVYGGGTSLAAEEWSPLLPLAAAPAGSGFSYGSPSLGKDKTFNIFYNVTCSGLAEYTRTMHLRSGEGSFLNCRWQEAEPFAPTAEYGYTQLVNNSGFWLMSASHVYRTAPNPHMLDVSPNLAFARCTLEATSGSLFAELDNASGAYNEPPCELSPGGQVELSAGFITEAGAEAAPPLSFDITKMELVYGSGQALLRLYCHDGWQRLANWRAPHLLTWNHNGAHAPVAEILADILARTGLSLSAAGGSSLSRELCPPFSLNPGDDGASAVRALTSLLPDSFRLEGTTACLKEPVPATPVYSYSAGAGKPGAHPVYHYCQSTGLARFNHVRLFGEEGPNGRQFAADALNCQDIAQSGERLNIVRSFTAATPAEAQTAAELMLARAAGGTSGGTFTAPVNAGLELYDVVEITRPGRTQNVQVCWVETIFNPTKAEYRQQVRFYNL